MARSFLLVPPRVVNCTTAPYERFIGRPTKWGNPFELGRDGGRVEVIRCYRQWMLAPEQRWLRVELLGLRDLVLGCYCKPLACHGDVLVELFLQQAWLRAA